MKSKQFLKDKNAVYCFDIDGVLAPYEYGKNNHNACLEDDWEDYLSKNDLYSVARPVKTIRKFIKAKDINRTFVITKASCISEFEKKSNFVVDNYKIKRENIIMVANAEEKLNVMNKIWNKNFKHLLHSQIVMVDDTVSTLNHIQENSDFATMHVSSFLV